MARAKKVVLLKKKKATKAQDEESVPMNVEEEVQPTPANTTQPKKARKNLKRKGAPEEEGAPAEQPKQKKAKPKTDDVTLFWGRLPHGLKVWEATEALGLGKDLCRIMIQSGKGYAFVKVRNQQVADKLLANSPVVKETQTVFHPLEGAEKSEARSRTIFVVNVPAAATEADFKKHWAPSQFRELQFDPEYFRVGDKCSRGVALAEFETREMIHDVLKKGSLTIKGSVMRMRLHSASAYEEGATERTLKLTGIPHNIPDEAVKKHFSPVKVDTICWSFHPTRDYGAAYVTFNSVEDANKARSKGCFVFNGTCITVTCDGPRAQCFVTRIPRGVTGEQLQKSLSGAVHVDLDNAKRKAWVLFSSKSEAEAAAAAGTCVVPGGSCTVAMCIDRRLGGRGRGRGRGRGKQ